MSHDDITGNVIDSITEPEKINYNYFLILFFHKSLLILKSMISYKFIKVLD